MLTALRRVGLACVAHSKGARLSASLSASIRHGKPKPTSASAVAYRARLYPRVSSKRSRTTATDSIADLSPTPALPISPPPAVTDRALILSILNAKPTKREARMFVNQFVGIHERLPTVVVQEAEAVQHPLTGMRLGIVRIDAGLSQFDLDSFVNTLVAMSKLGLNPVIMLDFESMQSTPLKHKEPLTKVISVLPHRRKRYGITSLLNKSPIPTSTSSSPKASTNSFLTSLSNLQHRVLMLHESERIVASIERAGGRAISMMHSRVFQQTLETGKVSCNATAILRQMKRGAVPVLVPVVEQGEDGKNVVGTVRMKHVLVSLAQGFVDLGDVSKNHNMKSVHQILPAKIFLMNENCGGIRINNHSIGLINLVEEGSTLMQDISRQETMTPHCYKSLGDLKLAQQVLNVLGALSPSSSAILGSVKEKDGGAALIANWITDKPMAKINSLMSSSSESEVGVDGVAPPTVLRTGMKVVTHVNGLQDVDVDRLGGLLESSFGKKLHTEAFFERIRGVVDSVILAGDYEGAVIVTAEKSEGGKVVYYLDKFAVRPESQGLGIADILWKRLVEAYPNLCWRSRTKNPVNKWYFDRSEGNMKFGQDHYWMMFWYGNEGIPRLTEYKKDNAVEGAVFTHVKIKHPNLDTTSTALTNEYT
ncbi:UNVERIFIED_CONTAM: Amino-acid acetyltransferase, mitochondrial [Siphonaria sp. JEL0065]|nr:Amino-acid acetyltransferase, mitochondrial [Siphonaria sp. JEL0065]